jgi:2-polyprenyl-6-methoxyphenol hydroxylase-like FAD-dependent oxidoreductase
MSKRGDRAIVCGAGVGGLLAARVLSEFFGTVTVVERDKLSDAVAPRRGVPQGRHFHVLWSRGSRELGELFPGLHDELVAAGATVIHLLSRPLLESQIRRRVAAIANVEFIDGHDLVEPIAAQPQQVTGALVVNRDSGVEQTLDADLVVDAMGRSARTPAFLDQMGYGRPPVERSQANASYSSQLMRIPAGVIAEKMTFVIPEAERQTGGAFSVYEHDTWIFTVVRLAGTEPPDNLAKMLLLAEQFAPPAVVHALQQGQPVGEVAVFRYPGGTWRRYDKMSRFPAGFLVFGDAIASTNPIYGQGMTVAALEAASLRECLSESNGDLSRRFFDAAAQHVGPLWASNQFNDIYMANGNGQQSIPKELLDFREEVLAAAEHSPALTEKLFRAMNLIDPPTDYSPLLR